MTPSAPDSLTTLPFDPVMVCQTPRCRTAARPGVAVIEYRPEAIADPRALFARPGAGQWVVCATCLTTARRPQRPYLRNGIVRVVRMLGRLPTNAQGRV